MKVVKASIKSETFRGLKISQNILKYFKTTSPFESKDGVHSKCTNFLYSKIPAK